MNNKPVKIVFAEDNTSIAKVVNFHLDLAGFKVIHFNHGDLVIPGIIKNDPDLIILDLNMPGKNGHDILKELKQIPALKYIPVIFLTATNDANLVKEILLEGAADYVLKPFTPGKLLERIRLQLQNIILK